MTATEDALDALPSDARARLEAFAQALERVHVDDLILHVTRRRAAQRRRAGERAAVVARQSGLEPSVDAARVALVEGVLRELAAASLRIGMFGINALPTQGPTDDRIRILESLGDAVTALVLWERLSEDDRSELLGMWGRLLP
jgi:hypothetical protein